MDTARHCPSCGKPLAADAPQGICPECLMKAGFGTASGSEAPGAASFVPPTVEALAKLFPQLELLELIGKGGMGAVYKARQPTLDRLVALKILPPRPGSDPGFAERFTREARALAKLSHPNIVAVYDFGQADGLHYFIMEYVDGPNLRQVERAGKLTPREAVKIIPQICEALQFAHEEGIVHRDIKPENVLLDRKGRVKIADFGLAKLLGQAPGDVPLTCAGQVMGTPHYMAPEQVEHPQEVDHRADIYSLGVVFYEMLTGELPLGKFAPPSRKVQVDVRLDEVVLRTLEKEPERRYQSAGQVKTAVETISTQGSAAAPKAAVSAPAADNPWHQVKGPAIGLIVAGIINWLSLPLVFAVSCGVLSQTGLARIYLLAGPLFVLVLGTVIFLAGLKMKRLEAYPLAVTGSILAIMFSPTSLVGLPLGIWALVVLAHKDIRAAFASRASGSGLPPPPPSAPAPGSGAWKVAAVIAAVLMLVLAIPVGAVLLSITLPAWQRAHQQQAGRITAFGDAAAVQARLAREIGYQLQDARFAFEGVQVNVTASDYKAAECDITGLRKRVSEGITNGTTVSLFETASGALDLRYTADGLWVVEGHGDLKNLRFTVDTSAEMELDPLSRSPKLAEVYGLTNTSFEKADGLDSPQARLPRRADATAAEVFLLGPEVISKALTATGDRAWSVVCTNTQVFRLFEVPTSEVGARPCKLTYQAQLKSEGLEGRAYLEMWCQFPGVGQAFSRGLDDTVSGSSDWATCQTPFFLKAGEKPELVKLNLVVEGKGKVFIKDVRLMATPLK